MGTRNFFLSHARDKTKNVFLYFFNELKTYQFLISWAPGMKFMNYRINVSIWATGHLPLPKPTSTLTYYELIWRKVILAVMCSTPAVDFVSLQYSYII